jgi:hypothetical protein
METTTPVSFADGFDHSKDETPILTSPRSVYACEQEGLVPQDLIYRDANSFTLKRNETEELKQRRAERYDIRRRQRIRSCSARFQTIADKAAEATRVAASAYQKRNAAEVQMDAERIMQVDCTTVPIPLNAPMLLPMLPMLPPPLMMPPPLIAPRCSRNHNHQHSC